MQVRRLKGGGKHTSLAGQAFLFQENVQEVQDKVLHCSALYGIIVLTRTNHHLTRRREPCSIRYEPLCAGKIELLEPVDLPEGTTVLVTPLIEEDTLFWARVSHVALDAIWDNAEDDVYAQLLKE